MILLSLATLTLLSVQTTVLGESQIGMTIRTAAHIPAFALVAVGWFAVVHPSGPREFWLLAVLIVLALLAELSESLVYNDLSTNDLADNGFGILLGYLGWKFFRLRDEQRGARIACCSGIVLILAGTVFAPIAIAVQKAQDQKHWFPILFDARMTGARDMIASLGPEREVELNWLDDRLRVRLLGGSIPGIALHDFQPDWQAYSTLIVDVENPSSQALRFEMHIRDKEGSAAWGDRYNFQQFLGPGTRSKLRIPLAEVHNAPEVRTIQLDRLNVIAMYSGAGLSDTFILHSVALE